MAEKLSDFDYPKWKYHATKTPMVVNNYKEERALGPGWENSPAYFEKKPVMQVTGQQKKKKE